MSFACSMGCLVEVARYECVLCVGVDEIGVGRCVQNRAWEYIESGSKSRVGVRGFEKR
jgi:hypothetical protein